MQLTAKKTSPTKLLLTLQITIPLLSFGFLKRFSLKKRHARSIVIFSRTKNNFVHGLFPFIKIAFITTMIIFFVITSTYLLKIFVQTRANISTNIEIIGLKKIYHSAFLSSFTTKEPPLLEKEKSQSVFINHGSRDKKEIALTFDADMTYGMDRMLANGEVPTLYDERLIQILKDAQTPATLFLTGLWIETYPQEAKALAESSLFELASHSYSHPSFNGDCYGLGEIPDEENAEQLRKTQSLLKDLTGTDNKLFRFPGGCYSENDVKSLKEFNLTAIQWDAAGDDGFNHDADKIKSNIMNSVQNGSIIVLHMNGGTNETETANVVAEIIPLLREKGYRFVMVSDLLEDAPFPTEKMIDFDPFAI